MSVISGERFRSSTLLHSIKRGFKSVVEGLGFGLLCVLIYLVPLGIAYMIYQLLV